ncbi:hypothetical protein X801_03268, partial [Opisthorchis viverrini]
MAKTISNDANSCYVCTCRCDNFSPGNQLSDIIILRQLDISPILHEEQDLSDYFPNDALLYTPREDLQPSTFQTHGQYQSSADAELSHRDWMAHMQRQSLPHLLRTNGFTLRTQRLSRLNQAVKRDD